MPTSRRQAARAAATLSMATMDTLEPRLMLSGSAWEVSLATDDRFASEQNTDPAAIIVSRMDMGTGDINQALTVNYTVGGTAEAGDDYQSLTGVVDIPAGQTSASIAVTPVDDGIPEFDERVALTLAAGADYDIDPLAQTDTVTLVDNDLGVVATGEPFTVSQTVDPTPQQVGGADIAFLAGGGRAALWCSIGDDGSSWGVFGQMLDADGATVGSQFVVNATSTGIQNSPAVAPLANGNFVAIWRGKGADDSTGVVGRLFDATGTALSGEFQINTTTQGVQEMPAVAALADGRFVVTWSGKGTGDNLGVFGRLFAADGTPVDQEFALNVDSANSQQWPAVAALPDGGFLSAWTSGFGKDGSVYGVFARRFDSAGVATGAEFQVNTTAQSSQQYPSIAVAPDGAAVIVWQSDAGDGSATCILGQRYDASGAAAGAEFLVNSYTLHNQWSPSVAFGPGGRFLVSWSGYGDTDTDGVYAREFAADGTPLRDQFLVTDDPWAGTQKTPIVTGSPDAYAVAWSGVDADSVVGVSARFFLPGNTAPTTSGLADVQVLEDAPDTIIDLFGAFADTEHFDEELSYTVAGNTNPALFASETIDQAAGTLALAYAPNANGTAELTIRATDPRGLFVDTTFTVVVTPVNDVPTTSGIADVGVDEDAPATVIDLAAAFADIETPDADLTYEVIANTNAALFSATDVTGTDLTLSYAPNANGAAAITVRATDPEGASAETTFNVAVAAVNDVPTTSGIADVAVDEDADPTVIDLNASFADVESGDADLAYTVQGNTNPSLFSSVTLGQAVDLAGVTAGLLGHWQLDDGAGTTALDSAGANDGTLAGGPVWTEGSAGGAVQLDGTDDYVGLGNPAELNFIGQITIAAWVRPEATDGLRNIVAHGHHLSPNGEVYLRIANGQYQIGSWNGTGHNTAYAVPSGDVGQWVHLAGSYDGSTWRLYRNGVEVAATADATGAVLVQDNWAIGARGTGTERFFEGAIDDVRIYDRALTAGELAEVPNGKLTLAYAPNANGSAAITVRATDPEGASVETTFNVVVAPVNDIPTTSGIADVAVDEDAPATVIDLAATFADIETSDADMAYTVTANTNAALFSSTDISGTELTLAYAANAFGSGDITVRATDPQGAFVETTFNVSVAPVNDTPTTSGIADVAVDEDAAPTVIDLTGAFADVETGDANLAYGVVANTNPSLFSSVDIPPATFLAGVTDGLAGHWQFDDGSGSLAADATGNGNDGALNGAPIWSDGAVGGALNFNGTSDYVDLGNPAALDITGPITLSAWIKPESTDGFRNILARGYVSNPAAEVYLRIDNGQYQAGSWTGGGQNHRAGFAVPAEDIGQWVHLCGVYDGTTWRLYRNGQEVATGVDGTGAVSVNDGWAIGARSDGTERFFDGQIDDVRIYDRALTAEEVAPVTDGRLTLAYVPNANGSAAITVRATDPEGASVDTTFNVVVAPVNDIPTTSGIADVAVDEDAAPTVIDLAAAFADIETPDGDLIYDVIANTNAPLFDSTGINGTNLTLAYAADAFGSADVTVRATDADGASAETTFNVTVTSVNDVPTTSGIADVAVDEDAAPTVIDLAAAFADVETSDGDLTYEIVSNSNAQLFDSTDIAGAELMLAYAANAFGSADITIRATDADNASVETTFNVTVASINDVPTTSGIADISVDGGTSESVVDLAGAFADVEEASADLTYTIVDNTNGGLFSSTDIDPVTGELTLVYGPGQIGTADLTVRATDSGGLFAETTFGVEVLNTAPVGLGIANISILEDASPTYVDLYSAFADIQDSDEAMTYEVVSNTNPDVVVPLISDDGQLSFAYEGDAFGTAEIVIRATDTGGLSAENAVIVDVDAVNDAPVIGALLDGPDPAIEGANLTLEVDGVTDDSADVSVSFYRDADGDGELDIAVDQLLGVDTLGTNAGGFEDWSVTVSTDGFGPGAQTYFAQATDSGGLASAIVSATGTVGIIGVIDDGEPGYEEYGSYEEYGEAWTDGATGEGYKGDHRVHIPGVGASSAQWTFTGLVDGPHKVYVTWVPGSDRATDAPFTVYDGPDVEQSFAIDQQAAPATVYTDGAWWQLLGTYEITSGLLAVHLTDEANGVVVADAVRVVDPPPTIDSLSADRDRVIAGDQIALTAEGVADSDGTVTSVAFYRDSNDNDTFDVGTDDLVGTDTVDSDGWSVTVDTSTAWSGGQTFFAQATDNDSLTSEAASLDVTGLADVTSGLLGHWRLNDASGTAAQDAAGSNDGTLSNGPVWIDGQAGGALNFDGTNDYVGLGNPSELNFTGQITIAAWVKPDATNSLRNIVAHGHHLSPHGEVFLRIADGQYQIGSWNGTAHYTTSAVPGGDIGNWVHLAGSYDGSTWRLYRNGVEVAATADATGAVLVQDNWAIGARGTGTERFFDGGVDDVRIYNRALADSEVITLADKGIDHAPVIGDQTFAVPDSPVDGSVVGTVAASDPDPVDTVSYAITDGNAGGAFAIDSATGQLTVADASALDFAPNSLYQLTIEVTNSPDSGASDTAVITVFESDVTVGLLGHWTLDGTAADSAGDNDGTVSGATWSDDGTMGGALALDGSGDYVSLGNPSELNFTGAITLSAWVKPEATNGIRNIVSHGHVESPKGEVVLKISDGQYVISSWDGTGHGAACAIPAGDIGSWVHLTGTYDGTHWRLYRNGVEVAATAEATGAVLVGGNWAIGSRGNGGERFFKGMIDDVRIYDRALSAGEATVLAGNHVNSAPQIATQGFDVPETASDGTVVGTVVAGDVDVNDTITFEITAGNHGGAFAIDPANGQITVADSAAMDFVTYPVYNLTVEVTDDGVPALSSQATVQIAPSDLTAGLVGHWHLDEATGTLASDATANDNDGTVAGNPAWIDGREGASALQLDGSGDYVSLGNPDELKITGDITLSAWIRPEDADSHQNIIAHGHALSPKGEVYLRIVGGQYQVGSWNGSSHLASAAVPAEDIGNWVLLTGTYDGATWRLYRNGSEAASSADSTGAVSVNANWAIGARGTGTERYFNGAIDEVRIYDRALTAAEAQALIDTAANAQPEIEDQTFATPAGSAVGTVVGTVIASDIDDDTLSFAITAGNVGDAFAINSSTGQITVDAALDFGTNPVYSLTIEVTDNGAPARSDSAVVSIMAGDITDGLLGHWQLDDAGTTALDSAGDNDGTLAGGPVWTDGQSGGALRLDGTNDYVNLGNPTELNFTGAITIAAWVRPEATDGLRNIVAHGHHRSPDGEVFLRIANGQYQIGSWNGTGHNTASAVPAGDVGNWVHLVGTYDGATWRLYRNGAQIAATADATGAVLVQDDWAIGARGTGTERFFDGTIDDVRIYDRAVNEAEIAVLIGRQPEMTALAGPSVVMAGMDANLTAEAYDPVGTVITSVEFYRDANANGTLEVGTDVLVDTDTDSSDGWSAAAATTGLTPSQYVVFARGIAGAAPTNTVATAVTVSADAAIADNGDSAYAEPAGAWSDGQMAGAYGQDYRQVYLDGATNTATWTFDDLADGSYAVYTTHIAAANHVEAADFTIYEGSAEPNNIVGSATIDQQAAPGDLAYAGSNWALIGYVTITGGQLTVEVSSNTAAAQWLLADAVCIIAGQVGQIMAVDVPEMITLGDSIQFNIHVLDPANSVDSINVYVDSNSSDSLDSGDELIAEAVEVEGEDRWVASADTTDTGDKKLFVQAVVNGTPGDYATTTVLVSTAAAIVDNADEGFSTSGGNWDTSTGGYGGDCRFHTKGSGSASATWNVTGLDTSKYYHVYATWASFSTAARDAEFTVSGVTASETRGVDQRYAPDDLTADGCSWATLGVYKPTGADSLTVALSNYRHGAIVADAIRIEESAGYFDITGNVTDFYSDHTDFQGGYPSQVMPGFIQTELSDPGGVPLLETENPGDYTHEDAGIDSPDSFAGWYPGTGSDETIRLADIGGGVYKYSSTSFFPLGRYNNHFTMQAAIPFTYYEGTGQYVEVINDDDVWVFINDTLAIDSGGYHWPAGGTAYLDYLALTDGQAYTIDIFTAERQIWGSTFEVTFSGGPKVSIAATNAYARETAATDSREIADIGVFTVSRGEGNVTGDLVVNYTIDTSPTNAEAAADSDYVETLSGTVTIPNGESSATITVTPVDDSAKEWDEVVRLMLTGTGSSYNSIDSANATATVTILDNDEIGGLVDRNVDTESTGLSQAVVSNGTIGVGIQQGDVTLAMPLTPYGFAPSYRSDDNLHPIVSVEMQLPGSEIPEQIQATLTFGGMTSDTATYSLSDISSTGDELRFVLLGDETIVEELRTGHWDYDVKFLATFDDGSTLTRTVRGSSEVVNLVDDVIGETQYGDRWWVDGLNRIVPDDGNSARLAGQGLAALGGTALVRGDNTSGWYAAPSVDADHVRQIIDNDDSAGFAKVGDWTDGTYTGGYGGYIYHDGDGTGTHTATWTFDSGLAQERLYQVFTTWVPGVDRTAAAPFEITGATRVGTRPKDFDGTVEIDQQYTPGEVLYNGTRWRSLGFYTLDSGSSEIAVELDASGLTDQVVADAVMILEDWQYVTPEGSFNELHYFDADESAGSIAGASYFVRSDYAAEAGSYALLTKWGGRYEFDYKGLLDKHVDRNNNQVEYGYTGDDFLTSITTQGGLTWNYTYSGGKLSTISDFNSRVTTYTVGDHLTAVAGPAPGGGAVQPQTTFVYAGAGDGLLSTVTTTVSGSASNVTSITYDNATFRVTSVTNADDNDWQITPFLVDGLSGPVIRKPAAGFQDTGAGTFIEARATYTDGRGNDWTYQSDEFGLTTAERNPAPFQDVWTRVRDANGLVTSFTEPAGGGGDTPFTAELTTTYAYDGRGNVTTILYTDGTSDVWGYDGNFSRISSYEDPLGRETGYTLNSANGNIDSVTEYDVFNDVGEDRVTTYDDYTADPSSITALAGGLVESVTVADGSIYGDDVTTTTTYYDTGLKTGLVHMVTYADGTNDADVEGTVIYGYDNYRNPTSVEDELERVTLFAYDNLDRLIATTLPDPGTGDHGQPSTDYYYDAVGNNTAVVDAAGNQTDYTYDGMGRLLTTTLPAPGGDSGTDQTPAVTTLTYDANGNLKTITSPLGMVTEHDYDQRNLRTSTTLPAPNTPVDAADPELPMQEHDAPEITFEYDTLGNLKSQTDPLDHATTFTYDELHRQTHITRPATSGDDGHASPVTRYEYDDAGQVIKAYNPDPKNQDKRVVEYEYDSFGRLISQTLPANEDGDKAVTEYEYDLRDNRVIVINAKNQMTEMTYDARNRVTDTYTPDPDGAGSGKAIHTAYEYELTGEVLSVTVSPAGGGDQRKTTSEYDDLGRVTQTETTDPDGIGAHVPDITTYEYDVMGNQTFVTVFSRTEDQSLTTEYYYDDLNRTYKVIGPADALGYQSETITVFDLAGRPVKLKQKTDPTSSVYRTSETVYDDLDRPYKQIGSAPGGGADVPITYTYYDAAGNVRFVVDAAQKSSGAINVISETEYRHDELNRTIEVEESFVGVHSSPVTEFVYNIAGETVQVIDALERATDYVFDNLGQLLKMILPAASPRAEILYSYDILGNMVSTTDPEGNVSQYVYDGLNRQINTISPVEDGQAPFDATIDDGDTGYTESGTWTSETDANAYGGDHHFIDGAATDIASWTFTVDADTKYMVLATWAADDANAPDATYTVLDGSTSEGTIEADQTLAPADRVLDAHSWHILGLYTITATGSDNLTVQLSGESAESGARVVADAVRVIEVGPTTTNEYDGLGQLISTTDSLGQVTTYEYDQLGRQTRVIYPNPDGSAATSTDETFDDDSAVLAPTDPADWQTETTKGGYGDDYTYYDGTGTGTHTATWTVTVEADTDYDVLATWVPNDANAAAVTFKLFDGTTSTQIGSDIVVDQTQLTADAFLDDTPWQRLDLVTPTTTTLIVQIDAPNGAGIVIADAIRVVEAVPASYTTYDVAGNVLTQRNAKGETTTFGYDELFQQTSVTDANGATTTYGYDYLGRNTSITDPEGNTTTYIYDGLDRVVEEQIVVDSVTLSRTVEFDAMGNTTRFTDRDGRVVTYAYDELHRVISETWYDNATDADAEQNEVNAVTYDYDIVSRTTGVADGFSDYDYTYDNRDRLTTITSDNDSTGDGPPVVVLTLEYGRDDDMPTSLSATIDGTGDFKNTYTYDDLLRTTEIAQAAQDGGNAVAGKSITFAYRSDGQLDTTARYADADDDGSVDDLVATTSYTYDDAGRLTDLVHANGATQIAAYNWTFDAAGRITQFLHTDYTDTDHTSDYTYDDAGQLTAADHDTQSDEAYTYDDNGNRITGNGASYDTGDQNRMTTDGTYEYQYDDEGNRTLRYVDADTSGTLNTGDTDITTYTYDHRNRLVEVIDYTTHANYTLDQASGEIENAAMTAEYIYDVNGDRIAKIVDADGSGAGAAVRTNFVILDSEILLEFNGQTLAYRYLPGLGIDMNLAIEEIDSSDGSTVETLWSLPDHQGTVRDVIDDSGVVQNHIEYNTYGEIVSESDDTVDYRFTYTGRELDEETGLYYYRARYYDAVNGVFISVDPIGFEANDANLYRYVSNSPMMGTDPMGLKPPIDAQLQKDIIAARKAVPRLLKEGVFETRASLAAKKRYFALLRRAGLPVYDGSGSVFAGPDLYFKRRILTKEQMKKAGVDMKDLGARVRVKYPHRSRDELYTEFGFYRHWATGEWGLVRQYWDTIVYTDTGKVYAPNVLILDQMDSIFTGKVVKRVIGVPIIEPTYKTETYQSEELTFVAGTTISKPTTRTRRVRGADVVVAFIWCDDTAGLKSYKRANAIGIHFANFFNVQYRLAAMAFVPEWIRISGQVTSGGVGYQPFVKPGGPAPKPSSVSRFVPKQIAKNPRFFRGWLKSHTNPGKPLSHQQARELINAARKLNIPGRTNAVPETGGTGKIWAGVEHIHVGGEHIPVKPGFKF